jgi:hypothetical protein
VEDVIRHLCCGALLSLGLNAAAQPTGTPDEDGYNEFTIRASHYPVDAPRFEDYPAKVYKGPLAPTQWRADPASRMFRTHLIRAGEQRPNFAGHFSVASWGCGAGCYAIAFVDARTGKVRYSEVATNVVVNHHADAGDSIRYRPDSRLLVLIGMPNEDPKLRGISFYEWTGTRLKLLRRVPVGWYPDLTQ